MHGHLSQDGWKILRGLYHGESKIPSREPGTYHHPSVSFNESVKLLIKCLVQFWCNCGRSFFFGVRSEFFDSLD